MNTDTTDRLQVEEDRKRERRLAGDAWLPLERLDVPPSDTGGATGEPMDECYVSAEYQVFVTFMDREDGTPGSADGLVVLSIKRNDKQPVREWRDKQAIKNEICGPEREAVELYPAESRLVDEADQAWLFVAPTGAKLPFGFGERRVADDRERRRALREKDGPEMAATRGSQAAWRPGIPTGLGGAA